MIADPPLTIRRLLIATLAPKIPELMLFGLAIAVLSLAVPVFSLQVYDRVIYHGGLSTLQALLIGVAMAIGFDLVLRQARARLMQGLSLALDVALSRALFRALTGQPLAALERQGMAEWQNWLRDIDVLRDTVAGSVMLLFVDMIFVVLFVATIAVIALPLLPVLLVLVPLYAVLAVVSTRMIDGRQKKEQGTTVTRDALVAELVAGRTTVQALDLGPALSPRWEGLQAGSIDAAMRRGQGHDLATHLTTELGLLTTVTLTGFGSWMILDHAMTVGGLIATNMLAARVIQPFAQLVGVWRAVSRAQSAAIRLDRLLALPVEPRRAAVAPARPEGVIAVEALSFAYAPTLAPVIEGLAFTLRPGAVHGIVGTNGTGKTTLLKLLHGLYRPDAGRVLLDGHDLAQLGAENRAALFGYVPQDPGILAGTVRETIARGRDDVPDERVRRAAELAGASAMIADWPEGYGKQLGEQGRLLSAGQRQRLALARALLDDPPVILLDEPSAHLDRAAEQGLIATLRALAANRTVVLASHSPAVLAACHDLMVLEKGRIAVAGPSATVLARLFAVPAKGGER